MPIRYQKLDKKDQKIGIFVLTGKDIKSVKGYLKKAGLKPEETDSVRVEIRVDKGRKWVKAEIYAIKGNSITKVYETDDNRKAGWILSKLALKAALQPCSKRRENAPPHLQA